MSLGSPLLAEALATVAQRMEPSAGAEVLARAIEKETASGTMVELARGLAAVAGRLELREAARVARQATRVLRQALEKEAGSNGKATLAEAVADLLGRMESEEASQAAESVARVLTEALTTERNGDWRMALVRALLGVARRMEPNAGAQVLAQLLEKEMFPPAHRGLAQGLVAVAGHLDPGKVSGICSRLLEKLVETAERDPPESAGEFGTLIDRAVNLLQVVEPETASHYSRRLAAGMASGAFRRAAENGAYPGMDALLTNASREEATRRATAAAAVGLSAHGPLPALASLAVPDAPLPCWLSTQDLVDLLKMPTCLGTERQVILKHLGNRYGRTFADHWQFVRFAQAQHLDLDFTTPPKRARSP
jgi:hypothetical protein